eukprot:3940808-Rhodomonas_salina.6
MPVPHTIRYRGTGLRVPEPKAVRVSSCVLHLSAIAPCARSIPDIAYEARRAMTLHAMPVPDMAYGACREIGRLTCSCPRRSSLQSHHTLGQYRTHRTAAYAMAVPVIA